jgi:hypothetical protein
MDEKGIQLGGGQKGNQTKFIILCDSCEFHKTSSSDLELVTMVGCVSAEGDLMPPGIIFEAEQFNRAWFTEENSGKA